MEKSYHHGDLRAALISTTLAMIEAGEEHSIGFRELARRLEVSRSAPYRHFSSVEHLLATVIEQGYLQFIERLTTVVEHPTWDKKNRFLQLGIAYIQFALDHPTHYRLMFDRRFFVESPYQEIKILSKRAFEILKATVQENLHPDSTDTEIKQMSQLAWASVHGMSRLFIDGQWQNMRHKQDFIKTSCERLLTLIH